MRYFKLSLILKELAFCAASERYLVSEHRPAVVFTGDIWLHHGVDHTVGFLPDKVLYGVLYKAYLVLVLKGAYRLGFPHKGLGYLLAYIPCDVVAGDIFEPEVENKQRRDYTYHIRDYVVDNVFAVGTPEVELHKKQQQPYQKRYCKEQERLDLHILFVFPVHFSVSFMIPLYLAGLIAPKVVAVIVVPPFERVIRKPRLGHNAV